MPAAGAGADWEPVVREETERTLTESMAVEAEEDVEEAEVVETDGTLDCFAPISIDESVLDTRFNLALDAWVFAARVGLSGSLEAGGPRSLVSKPVQTPSKFDSLPSAPPTADTEGAERSAVARSAEEIGEK